MPNQISASASEMGTVLFYAIEALGGEFRIKLDDAEIRSGEQRQVWMRVETETNELVIYTPTVNDK